MKARIIGDVDFVNAWRPLLHWIKCAVAMSFNLLQQGNNAVVRLVIETKSGGSGFKEKRRRRSRSWSYLLFLLHERYCVMRTAYQTALAVY